MNTPYFKISLLTASLAVALLSGCDSNHTIGLVSGSDSNHNNTSKTSDLKLHVASPDWRDQVIYHLMNDRFNDGDPSNNNQGAGEYNPDDLESYSGGDLQGITDQVDYLKEMGMTAVWVMPPVLNQWRREEFGGLSGYHGYWAADFSKVDPHMGTLETYKKLSHKLHSNDMYLIQDIVTNHMGNFFSYDKEQWQTDDPCAGYKSMTELSPQIPNPTQAPFDMNDACNEEQAKSAIYNWTPNIADFKDQLQEKTYQLSDLDDLNTANPMVRKALKDSYSYWIKEVGVDGFRLDTIKYVEHDFLRDFVNGEDGIEQTALSTGRNNFYTFGEVWQTDFGELENGDEKALATYLGEEEQPEIDAVLNFPLQRTLLKVFANGAPTGNLAYRLDTAVNSGIFADPYMIANFLDNHDKDRYLSSGNLASFKQALMSLMTIPGVPVIYYGSEQGFNKERRAAMFAGGYGSDGVDHFSRESELYQYLKAVANMRTSHKVLTRGTFEVLASEAERAGQLVYKRTYEGQTALVIFNTSTSPVLINDVATGLPAGTEFEVLTTASVELDSLALGENGKLTLVLPPQSAVTVLAKDSQAGDTLPLGATITTQPDPDIIQTENVLVQGKLSDATLTDLKLVVDGNLATAVPVVVSDDGGWEARISIGQFPIGESEHKFALYSASQGKAGANQTFQTKVETETLLVKVTDASEDENYIYPTDASFDRQMDVQEVKVEAAGSVLTLTYTMANISDTWNPSFGFDHMVFNTFIDLPDKEGATVLPHMNANTPEGFNWDLHHRGEGWGSKLYSSEGAGKDNEGTIANAAVRMWTDKDNNQVVVEIDGKENGITDWQGTKVYLTTWDWDGVSGALRPLTADGGDWAFGDGDGSTDPLIMDDIDVATLPLRTAGGAEVADPIGDENYSYPQDASFDRQMDLQKVSAETAGSVLTLTYTMTNISDTWNPSFGFDHAVLNTFIDLPGMDGATVLPHMNAHAPEGFNWDLYHRGEGWGSKLYGSEGADKDHEGKVQSASVKLSTDKANNQITLEIDAKMIGITDWHGAKIYVTSWDWDGVSGSLRPLTADGGDWAFGGGDDSADRKIMDDTEVLILP